GACGPMGGDAYYGYGPSPRAWGLLEISATEWGALRSIPTCVGPAHTFHSSYQARSVHPHVRGACVHVVQLGVLVDGPSPRAWGLRTRSTPRTRRARSIPTCVGPAYMWFNSGSSLTVHPHVRGACVQVGQLGVLVDGPSPRAWGLRAGTRRWCRRRRSIPTCVGPAFLDEARVAAGPVHPHVRGACQGHRVQGRSVCGPSPRAWGLPGGVPARTDPARSIPTCVGPAGAPTPSCSASTVHPHVRGACCGSHLDAQSLSGPSPRAWGLPTRPYFCRKRTRSIPTCVGPAPFVRVGRAKSSVHPHVRGACFGQAGCLLPSSGPSP